MKMSNEILRLFELFEQNHYQLYIIGGATRDMIMNNEVKEYDFTTDATPDMVEQILNDEFEVNLYRKDLGLSLVKGNDASYEITTMRKEIGVQNLRYPKKIKFVKSLKVDSLRRDFTINAVAYNPKNGYTDYQKGIEDINNRVVRFIGRPDKRSKEDPLRILRGIRFAGRLGFQIEPKTLKSFIKNVHLVNHLGLIKYKELFNMLEQVNINYLKDMMDIIKGGFIEVPNFEVITLCDLNLKSKKLLFGCYIDVVYESLAKKDQLIIEKIKDQTVFEQINYLNGNS